MLAIVTPAGVYHGHTETAESARQIKVAKKMDETLRILTDAEWKQVVDGGPAKRAELCSTLGQEL